MGAEYMGTLHDGKQLYSNPDGWCGVALEGEHTNCDPMRRTWQVNADGTIALRSGQQLYSNTKGWVGVAQEGDHTNTSSGRRTWDGLPRVPGPHLVAPHIANSQVALNDGRQLYVNPGGWAGATGPGQDANTAPGRNTWTHQPNGTLTLHDGKQLYSNPDGWCGVALE